ncbi:MAG: hypothetical protein AAF628_09790 [Planctomycetota bacterium]
MATPRTPDLPAPLARLHRWAHAQGWLHRFTLVNRLLLAMAFIPTGMVKLLGQRFTLVSTDNPVGFFFEAMYRTGPYWHFIGLVQVAAALLLLVPRTAAVGALLFAPVGLSVFLITWGMEFPGTVYVTAGMLLSVTYLICWDADRIYAATAPLLARRGGGGLLKQMHWIEALGWVSGGVAGIALLLTMRGFVPVGARVGLLGLGLAAAVAVVVGWIAGAYQATRCAS